MTHTKELELSIVIPNYNAKDMLYGCLESIYSHPPSRAFEVLVVDDASEDGSHAMVQQHFPQVRLLRNVENLHYCKSTNRGLKLARGRYVCLLNNDTVVLSDALDTMMRFLDLHPQAGAVGSRLLNSDGTIQASVKALPSLMTGFFGARSIISKLFPGNYFSRRELLHLNHDMSTIFQAGYVSGASTMLRQEVIQQIGYLDEAIIFPDDADYCKRIWDAGWKVYYLPNATIIHFNHRGGTRINLKRRFKTVIEYHIGFHRYFRKHHMRSAWSPMYYVIPILLGLSFVVSFALQAVKELLNPLLRTLSPGRMSGRRHNSW